MAVYVLMAWHWDDWEPDPEGGGVCVEGDSLSQRLAGTESRRDSARRAAARYLERTAHGSGGLGPSARVDVWSAPPGREPKLEFSVGSDLRPVPPGRLL